MGFISSGLSLDRNFVILNWAFSGSDVYAETSAEPSALRRVAVEGSQFRASLGFVAFYNHRRGPKVISVNHPR